MGVRFCSSVMFGVLNGATFTLVGTGRPERHLQRVAASTIATQARQRLLVDQRSGKWSAQQFQGVQACAKPPVQCPCAQLPVIHISTCPQAASAWCSFNANCPSPLLERTSWSVSIHAARERGARRRRTRGPQAGAASNCAQIDAWRTCGWTAAPNWHTE
jgi:hypothetical protein